MPSPASLAFRRSRVGLSNRTLLVALAVSGLLLAGLLSLLRSGPSGASSAPPSLATAPVSPSSSPAAAPVSSSPSPASGAPAAPPASTVPPALSTSPAAPSSAPVASADKPLLDWSLSGADPDGLPATATAETSSSRYTLAPNQAGHFPRVPAQPGETVSLAVSWPSLPAGESVVLAAADGGSFPGAQFSRKLALGQARSLATPFILGQERGLYRITLATASGDQKIFQFWVGPPAPVAEPIPR